MKNKKIFFTITIIIFLIFLIIIFYKNLSKISKIGHTNTSQEIVDNILNISSYEAIIDVRIESNKNQNQYKIKQKYSEANINSQEILEPENISGIKIYKDGQNLVLENSSLNLTSIIENYQYLYDNILDLSSFIEDYKKDDKAKYSEKDEIIMTTNYSCQKNLYIDRKTGLPTRMEAVSANKSSRVYILYSEVKIK